MLIIFFFLDSYQNCLEISLYIKITVDYQNPFSMSITSHPITIHHIKFTPPSPSNRLPPSSRSSDLSPPPTTRTQLTGSQVSANRAGRDLSNWPIQKNVQKVPSKVLITQVFHTTANDKSRVCLRCSDDIF